MSTKRVPFGAPPRVCLATVAAALALAFSAASTFAQSCTPASLQRDAAGGSGATVVRLAGDYRLREEGRRTVQLKAGQAYWFAASGCPRTGDVQMTLIAPSGKEVLVRTGHVTGGCVKPEETGNHTLVTTPISLRGSYDWGSIAAEGKESDCTPGG